MQHDPQNSPAASDPLTPPSTPLQRSPTVVLFGPLAGFPVVSGGLPSLTALANPQVTPTRGALRTLNCNTPSPRSRR